MGAERTSEFCGAVIYPASIAAQVLVGGGTMMTQREDAGL
jgi:hypothetical protein